MTDAEYDAMVASNPPIDEVREEAARVCEETARWERGERVRLQNGEFSDGAFGVSSEVTIAVFRALRATGKRVKPEIVWDTAARLLRAGYQRGASIIAHEVASA